MKAPAFRSEGWGFALVNRDGTIVAARSGYATEHNAIVQGRRFAQRQEPGTYVFQLLDPTGRVHEPVEIVAHGRRS